jgi:hypothetical protein
MLPCERYATGRPKDVTQVTMERAFVIRTASSLADRCRRAGMYEAASMTAKNAIDTAT